MDICNCNGEIWDSKLMKNNKISAKNSSVETRFLLVLIQALPVFSQTKLDYDNFLLTSITARKLRETIFCFSLVACSPYHDAREGFKRLLVFLPFI